MNKYLLMTAAALIGAATSAAGNANAGGGPYTIKFDGYCDGMTFHRSGASPIAVGEHLNEDCGGRTGAVAGTVDKKEFLLFETLSGNYSSVQQIAFGIHKPIRDGGKYDLYVCFSGTTCYGGNGGTYSLGCCDARAAGRPVSSKVAEIIAQRRAARHQ